MFFTAIDFKLKPIYQTNVKIKKLLSNESSLTIYCKMNYFFFKNSSTSSGDITASTKV